MATFEENLVTQIRADTTLKGYVGDRVFVNQLSDGEGDFIFLQQSDTGYEDALEDAAGGSPFRRFYDVECWSDKLENAIAIGNRLQVYFHLYTGTFGDTTVKRIFAPNQDEGYEPKGIASTDSFHGRFLRLEVIA